MDVEERGRPRICVVSEDPLEIHKLQNRNGFAVRFIPLGGIIVSIEARDRRGRIDNVVLGFRDLADYRTQKVFFGAVCGRYANRIAGARFSLDGIEYRLAPTDGTSSVHGGTVGFDKALWSVERLTGEAAILRYTS